MASLEKKVLSNMLAAGHTEVVYMSERHGRVCRPASDAGSAFEAAAADHAGGQRPSMDRSSPPVAASGLAPPAQGESKAKELARKGLAGLSSWRKKAAVHRHPGQDGSAGH